MLRDPKVIEHLQHPTHQRTDSDQSVFSARPNVGTLGSDEAGQAGIRRFIDEMKHADKLSSASLFLDGLPNVQRLNQDRDRRDGRGDLRADMRLEDKALDDLREAIAYCECALTSSPGTYCCISWRRRRGTR